MLALTRVVKISFRHSRRAFSSSPTKKYGLGGALFGSGIVSGALIYQAFRPPANTSSSDKNSSSSSTGFTNNKELSNIQYANENDIQKALDEIRNAIGSEFVDTTSSECEMRADSEWQSRHHKSGEVASAIVKPSSTSEVSSVLKIANQYKVPIVPVSGGTSLEGHFTPVYGGIALDMSRMDKVLKLNKADLDVVVQPAVEWEALKDELKPHGLMFGTDAGPGAQVGGMCACCSSGIGAFRYGPMRHNVLNLTVVLADGTIIKTKRRPRKSSAGYSLNDLFVGSEGTLGVVTELTLKLAPAPTIYRVGVLTFEKIQDATETVQELLLTPGLQLDAMEFMDDVQMRIVNEAELTEKKFDVDHSLLLRFAGSSPSSIDSEINTVERVAKDHHLKSITFADNQDDSDELWSARKDALWSMMNWAAPKKMWTTDVAVPISHLSQIIAESRDWMQQAGLTASIIGHVGDGNFHALIAYDPETEMDKTVEVVDRMIKRAIELDGTSTGEHGIGVGKRRFLVEEVSPETVAVMRNIKATLDPNMILNPGKVFSIASNDVADH